MPSTCLHLRLGAYIVLSGVATLGIVEGCVEHVLQTAREDFDADRGTDGLEAFGGANGAFVSCTEPTSADETSFAALPGAADLVVASPFVSDSYSAGEGPGLYVAARDVFRVYVNGELLAESQGGRVPAFLPLTLPPGDTVVALAVSAESGPAAALVHLAELEREYGSDGTWRASVDPPDGWMRSDFDDSGWGSATELGDRGEVPGCDPEGAFPQASTARWIGADASSEGTIALRRSFRIAPVGFGQATTGGNGTKAAVVTTFEELEAAVDNDEPTLIVIPQGIYDFRTAPRDQEVCPIPCQDDPTKIQNQVLLSGPCSDPTIIVQRTDQKLGLGSNKTIVGVGRGAALRGLTLDFQESENIIVRNVAIFDVNPGILEAGDAFSLTRPTRVWIDHGTVKWVSDGFTDLRAGTSDVSVSYMRYDGEMEEVCGGRHQLPSEVTESTLTLHHSRFDNVTTRAPFVTGANSRVHVFNNVYSGIGDWAVGSRCLAQVLLEGNIFEDADAATWRKECDGNDFGLIEAPRGSNLYRDDSNVHLGGDGAEPEDQVFKPPYPYELQTAADAWPLVISRAGTGGPWALPLVRD